MIVGRTQSPAGSLGLSVTVMRVVPLTDVSLRSFSLQALMESSLGRFGVGEVAGAVACRPVGWRAVLGLGGPRRRNPQCAGRDSFADGGSFRLGRRRLADDRREESRTLDFTFGVARRGWRDARCVRGFPRVAGTTGVMVRPHCWFYAPRTPPVTAFARFSGNPACGHR